MEIKVNNLTDEQLKEVSALVKKFEAENEKPKSMIDYKNGFIIAIGGKIVKASDCCISYVDNMHSIGLHLDTKKECEKLIKKMKIEHRLRQWSKMCEDKVDWSDLSQDKYFACCDCSSRNINLHAVVYNKSNNVYFTDKSILQKAIADIGVQKLIDEYFVEI